MTSTQDRPITEVAAQGELIPRTRPAALLGRTYRCLVATDAGAEKIYVTVTVDDAGRPFEVFATAGKAGQAAQVTTEAVARLVSLWLRSGGDLETLCRQLRGLGGSSIAGRQDPVYASVPAAITGVLDRYKEGPGK